MPTDKSGLQRLLGMIKYLVQYIPGKTTVTAPLRLLLREDNVWLWQHDHDDTVKKLREDLITAPVLIIQTDACKDGLDVCLMQDGHPITYASSTLTDMESTGSGQE